MRSPPALGEVPLRRALTVVNPIAGRGRGREVAVRLTEALGSHGIELDLAPTTQAGDGRAAAARAGDYDLVVAIGGDGTINEVVNGLEADRPVALFPLGTGNVLAKELRLPRRVERFCAMVERGRETRVDVGALGGERRFLSMVGVGFDAAVSHAVHARRDGAIRMSHYCLPLLRALVTYRFPRVTVRIDGGEAVGSAGFVLVSNVRSYGGPLVITPQAEHDDGLLDVCVLPRGSLPRYLRALAAFLLGLQRRLSGARYYRGRAVEITADEPVPCQVDGDPAGFVPARVAMLDRALRMVVP